MATSAPRQYLIEEDQLTGFRMSVDDDNEFNDISIYIPSEPIYYFVFDPF
jgi:hypothetical protein